MLLIKANELRALRPRVHAVLREEGSEICPELSRESTGVHIAGELLKVWPFDLLSFSFVAYEMLFVWSCGGTLLPCASDVQSMIQPWDEADTIDGKVECLAWEPRGNVEEAER